MTLDRQRRGGEGDLYFCGRVYGAWRYRGTGSRFIMVASSRWTTRDGGCVTYDDDGFQVREPGVTGAGLAAALRDDDDEEDLSWF